MAVTADSVVVELEARLDRFSREVKVAVGSFEDGMGKIGRSATTAELATQRISSGIGTLKSAALGFAAAFSVDKIIQLAGASLDYAASIGETSQQLGISTRAYQELSFAATQAGVEQGELEAGLAKLTRTLGEAREGGKKQVEAFKAIGVTFDEVQRLSPDEAFRRAAEGLSKIEDPARRAAIEVDLFGKSGQKLDTLLAGGVEQLDNLALAANRLGVVLSDDQIQNADDAADKLAALKTVLSANIAGIVSDNANSILKIADAIGQAVSGLGSLIRIVEKADRFKKLLETGDLKGIRNFSQNEALASLDRQFPLNSAPAKTPRTNTVDIAKSNNVGSASSTRNRASTAKRDPTPAELRLQSLSPANAGDFSGLTDADGKVKSVSDELDRIVVKFGTIDTLAVDLSNVEIIDQEQLDRAQRFGEDLSRGLADALVYGDDLGDVLVGTIKRAAAELVASQLLSLLGGGGSGGGGILGGIAKGLGSLFRANGGPVTGNQPYIVGERGPELFVPGSNGSIQPNGSFGGGGQSPIINQYLNLSLAGNAATQEDLAAVARITYQKSLEAFQASQRFGIPSV